ncbi:MAG: type II toxin-antitoxin system VapC family toxin [Stenotrophobium sp.]
MVLVDSTVWIDLLRGRKTKVVRQLQVLLDHDEAALAPVIYQEILQGASSAEALQALRSHFVGLPCLYPAHSLDTYERAAKLYARCRWQGITPRSPHDCLISQTAIEHRVSLLHDDRDYQAIARVEPRLQLYPIA